MGLLVLALLLTYFYRNNLINFFEKAKQRPSKSATSTAVLTSLTSSNTVNKDAILSKGSKGEAVRMLQKLLNDKHRQNTPTFTPLLVEDGKFGALTETMLKKYTNKTSISINQLLKALQ